MDYTPASGNVKKQKIEIIRHLGFQDQGDMVNHRQFVCHRSGFSQSCADIVEHLFLRIQDGFNITVRCIVGGDMFGSGYPICRITNQQDLEEKLIMEAGEIVGVRSESGDVLFNHTDKVDIFSIKKSAQMVLHGFENVQGEISVHLGGAYKLQLDHVELPTAPNQFPIVVFSGVFLFDDSIQRSTSLSQKTDFSIPRVTSQYRAVFKNGKLEPENVTLTFNEAVQSKDAQLLSLCIFTSLLQLDGFPLATLFQHLLSLKPRNSTHSIEGIFNVQQNDDRSYSLIGPKVIDFDGIETEDAWLLPVDKSTQNTAFEHHSAAELLFSRQLAVAGIIDAPSTNLKMLVQMKQRLRTEIALIHGESWIPQEVKESISNHILIGTKIFLPRRTPETLLADLLQHISIPWEETNVSSAQYYNADTKNTFLRLSFDGYTLAYWIQNGKYRRVPRLRTISRELSTVLRKTIVPAHFSMSREGD